MIEATKTGISDFINSLRIGKVRDSAKAAKPNKHTKMRGVNHTTGQDYN